MSKALPYSICSYQSDFASSSSVIQSTIGFNLWDSSSVRCTEDSDRDLVINLFSSGRKVLNGHNDGRFFDPFFMQSNLKYDDSGIQFDIKQQ